MTSKLNCPFCRRALARHGVQGQEYGVCRGENCPSKRVFLPIEIWQALIQAKKDLKDCQHNYSVKSEQHERGYAYATKTIKDLESKLEIATKALKNMSLGNVPSLPDDETLANAMCNYARDTLKQIGHKDK